MRCTWLRAGLENRRKRLERLVAEVWKAVGSHDHGTRVSHEDSPLPLRVRDFRVCLIFTLPSPRMFSLGASGRRGFESLPDHATGAGREWPASEISFSASLRRAAAPRASHRGASSLSCALAGPGSSRRPFRA